VVLLYIDASSVYQLEDHVSIPFQLINVPSLVPLRNHQVNEVQQKKHRPNRIVERTTISFQLSTCNGWKMGLTLLSTSARKAKGILLPTESSAITRYTTPLEDT
jgi:hypothetical protein